MLLTRRGRLRRVLGSRALASPANEEAAGGTWSGRCWRLGRPRQSPPHGLIDGLPRRRRRRDYRRCGGPLLDVGTGPGRMPLRHCVLETSQRQHPVGALRDRGKPQLAQTASLYQGPGGTGEVHQRIPPPHPREPGRRTPRPLADPPFCAPPRRVLRTDERPPTRGSGPGGNRIHPDGPGPRHRSRPAPAAASTPARAARSRDRPEGRRRTGCRRPADSAGPLRGDTTVDAQPFIAQDQTFSPRLSRSPWNFGDGPIMVRLR
jgi:hypothetical protein